MGMGLVIRDLCLHWLSKLSTSTTAFGDSVMITKRSGIKR